MSHAVVRLPAELADEIRRLCETAYPLEACGAIVGDGDDGTWCVRAVRALPNRHPGDQRRMYSVSPTFQARLEHEARALGQDVLGYFHSHPDCPARPSEHDRAQAWPGYLYAICSVVRGTAGELNAFALECDGGGFRRVLVDVPSDTPIRESR